MNYVKYYNVINFVILSYVLSILVKKDQSILSLLKKGLNFTCHFIHLKLYLLN